MKLIKSDFSLDILSYMFNTSLINNNMPNNMNNNTNNKISGELHIITGPMASGKSTELKRIIQVYQVCNKTIIIGSNIDKRSNSNILTHSGDSIRAYKYDKIQDFVEDKNINLEEYDVIGIDEGQFFPDLIEYTKILINMNKIIVISALDCDSEGKPFEVDISKLVHISDSFIKLNSICTYCKNGTKAIFSKYTKFDKTESIKFGGLGDYAPVCRRHFYE